MASADKKNQLKNSNSMSKFGGAVAYIAELVVISHENRNLGQYSKFILRWLF